MGDRRGRRERHQNQIRTRAIIILDPDTHRYRTLALLVILRERESVCSVCSVCSNRRLLMKSQHLGLLKIGIADVKKVGSFFIIGH